MYDAHVLFRGKHNYIFSQNTSKVPGQEANLSSIVYNSAIGAMSGMG
jgi:hypothetical protein